MKSHRMNLIESNEELGDHWFCPVCNREFWLVMQPYKKINLAEGDLSVAHTGSIAPKGVNLDLLEFDIKELLPEEFEEWIKNNDLFNNWN